MKRKRNAGEGAGAPAPSPPKRATAAATAAASAASAASAAAATAALDKATRIEQTFTCSICLDILCYPVSAGACSHQFCLLCLSRVKERRCPTCRAALLGAPASWAIQKSVEAALAANEGPAYLALAPTLRLHDALRSGNPAAALPLLTAGAAALELARPVRLAGSPLHVALAGATAPPSAAGGAPPPCAHAPGLAAGVHAPGGAGR